MSKQASPTLIGAFVVGAIAIFAAFVVVIGGDSFNRKSERYVVFFDESVNGLNVGSNVMFRGVPIGIVSNIELFADATTGEFFVPVYVDIFENSVRSIPGTEPTDEEKTARDSFNYLLDIGLRASLKPESIITGQLYIELDFHPDEAIVLRGFNSTYREVPSIRTGMQAILENTQRMVTDIQESIDVKQVSRDFAAALSGIEKLVNDEETQRVTEELNITLASLQTTLDNANSALIGIQGDGGEMGESLGNTLAELETLLATINARLSEGSDTTYRFNSTLQEIESAARSIRILSEYLEANPEALLQGKGTEQ